jgi:replicative DNA helicase
MKPGGTYILGAPPGVGKTTLACQVATCVASRGDLVLYVALEPSKLDVIQSCMSNVADVEHRKIVRDRSHLTQEDINALTEASGMIARWPLHAVDMSAKDPIDTVAGIEATIRALPTPPVLVVVDHLLRLLGTRDVAEEHKVVTEVVKAIVRLGKRTGATFLVLAHIGRGVAGKGGDLYHLPRVEHLAGGRTIEQEADGIILLHREDQRPTTKESKGDPTKRGIVEFFAPKLRQAPSNGYGVMRLRGEYQRFEEMAPRGSGADAPEENDV